MSTTEDRPPLPGPSPALEASCVTKRFGTVTALQDVSVRVETGRSLALVGESGSGKTTLLRCFNALVRPDAGTVRVAGRSLEGRDPIGLRRSLGYVPQQGGLLPHWTVLRNVATVPRLQGRSDWESCARRALARVGLEPTEYADRWPRTLSGGQRQRVALARALAHDPGVVLLDEPFGALDAITRAEIQEWFEELLRAGGLTVLLVTHDLREAARLADRIAVLRRGRVRQVASPSRLRTDPADAYVSRLLERAGLA